MNFLMVGLGGGIGALARYIISLIPIKTVFPILTFMTNFAGAFLIGIVIGIAEIKHLLGSGILFWKTGFCGGFTTFSTFSSETLALFEAGRIYMGALYALLSVVMCLTGVFMGKSLINAVF